MSHSGQEEGDEWDPETPPHYHNYLGYHESPSCSSQDIVGKELQPTTRKRKLEFTTTSNEESTSKSERISDIDKDKLFSEMHSQLSKFQSYLPKLRKMEKMPSYTGSRDLSRRLEAHLQQCLPPKIRDPGSFMITIVIGNNQKVKGMLDLEARVNLMPYSTYTRLGLGELKPTKMTLELVDSSAKVPVGIKEDVIVRIGK